jgi:hypothetical protein
MIKCGLTNKIFKHMKKLIYLLIAVLSVGLFSCESDYDQGLVASDTYPAYVYLSSTASKVATETKTSSITVTRVIPVYEDVTVNYEISSTGFSTITGSFVFPKTDGISGSNSFSAVVPIPASIVPEGEVSVAATFTLVSCTTSSGKEVVAGLKGKKTSLSMTINKYVPLDRTPFLGAALENDGSADYDVTITADPDNEFGLIITGGNWGPDGVYNVTFNTITNETLVSTQYIGVNYFGAGGSSDYDAVYYAPASPNGSFDTTTGNFTVNVNMSLPNYPYDLGDVLLTYTK